MRVIKKSDNGFQTEDNVWLTVDKFKLLNKPLFTNLNVGDSIDGIVQHGKYVVSFTLLNSRKDEVGVGVTRSSPKSFVISPTPLSTVEGVDSGRDQVAHLNSQRLVNSNPVQDSIRYAQCVNLAFQGTNFNDMNNCWYEDRIIENFDLADKIYVEFNKRCSR